MMPTGYSKPFEVLDKAEIIKGEVAWIKIQQNYRNGLHIVKMVIDGQVQNLDALCLSNMPHHFTVIFKMQKGEANEEQPADQRTSKEPGMDFFNFEEDIKIYYNLVELSILYQKLDQTMGDCQIW